MKKNNFLSILFTFLIAILIFTMYASAETGTSTTNLREQSSLSKEETKKIDAFIKKYMKDGRIPGMSVVIVKDKKTAYSEGFGYADAKTKRPITSETLFELGSNSKAFTGLGILQLEEKGLINLKDSISKYLPWFRMKYVGEYRNNKIDGYADITLEQLLHHTSGIPFKSIGDIPAAEDDNALENTVRTQIDKRLDFYPGEKFQYATINYDILGLVIQKVSGMSYENYITSNIINPLGMKNTYLFRDQAKANDMAKGYKYGFLKSEQYNAPTYRGNAPAGYVITCAQDIATWLSFQMGDLSYNLKRELVDKSHQPDRSVLPAVDGSSYAAGWTVLPKGSGEIIHGGSNPNFSSYIIYRPVDKIGVAVLTNINTSYTDAIGKGIMDILMKREVTEISSDLYKSLDNISCTIIFIALPFTLATLVFLIILFIQCIRAKGVYVGKSSDILKKIVNLILISLGIGYCLYLLPDILFWGLNWSFVKVWAPQSFLVAIVFLCTSIGSFCLYYLFASIFKKSSISYIFLISVLSILSGFGNAFVIFIINEALNREKSYQSGLLVYFAAGIVIYICGQKVVRTKLITLTNEIVFDKRNSLINSILKTPYQKFEATESSKILTGLNNDTETISNFINIIISGVTNLITLICCFVYMGMINFYGLLVSIAVILFSAGLYFIIGRSTNKVWEQTRDIQNIFFEFINNLVGGFKELSINNSKKHEFKQDMIKSCKEYKDKRIIGDMNFTNVYIIGELLFTIVIGFVAFVFPVIFNSVKNSTLSNFIFVFLYMSGPVHGVLNSIPEIVKVKISWKRIIELEKSLMVNDFENDGLINIGFLKNPFKIELKNIEYNYKNESFSLGPINIEFNTNEITFITGGNGSGKSTLAKIITGLYAAEKGEIIVNGQNVKAEELGQIYSAIFSEYYLFNKLYGIEYEKKEDEIKRYLQVLDLWDKLSINNGIFSTIKLSTGQRKRLALLISYLEDRPVYLFDEWASDQDPEFRKFFYNTLLPELKNRGKCIIAITHDDRYFDIADNIIKLDRGKVLEVKRKETICI